MVKEFVGVSSYSLLRLYERLTSLAIGEGMWALGRAHGHVLLRLNALLVLMSRSLTRRYGAIACVRGVHRIHCPYVIVRGTLAVCLE